MKKIDFTAGDREAAAVEASAGSVSATRDRALAMVERTPLTSSPSKTDASPKDGHQVSGHAIGVERVRLAYLVSQYPAINHTFILREIRKIRELGFEVHVASIRSADRPPELLTDVERDELEATYFVKSLGLVGAVKPHLETLVSRPARYFKGIAYALKLSRFDPVNAVSNLFYFGEAVIVGRWMQWKRLSHVHVHFSSTVGLIMTRVFPVTMSLTIHGPAEFDNPRSFRLREKVAASSFVCAISKYARSQLMRASHSGDWAKLEVCPLGVDPSVFEPRPARADPSPFEVICVGRLDPVKAQHILIAAIDRLVREGRGIRLRLVGDGPDREALERSVADRGLNQHVRFEGWLNQDGVLALYRNADAFALASFAEGVPVVLMEAMAMEIPCVATCITGVPELIRDGVDGLLVPPSDEEALASAIGTLIDDPALRLRLAKAGRQRVLEKYDLNQNTAHFASVLRSRIAEITDGAST